MSLWQSIPFACILLPLAAAALTAALPTRRARYVTGFVLLVQTVLSALLVAQMASGNESYVYMMGHYPAPWGNEIRVGLLESVIGLFFSLVMTLSVLGGLFVLEQELLRDRHSLMSALLLLLSSALQAQVYTNDLFTAYVFVEIMTISAVSLIAAHDTGRGQVAAMRYLIMNLIGSALFLLSIILLYDLTGHLLMSPIHDSVAGLRESGAYRLPLTVVVALMCGGLAIKSALWPFHTWVPDAYGTSTPAASAILSSLVSEGYVFLMVKLIWRMLGPETITATHVNDVILVFGIIGMISGSVGAIRQVNIKRLIAWSSVAQIGYMYMGIGLGTAAGLEAACFHILSHAAAKALLFLSANSLHAVSGSYRMEYIRGSGRRAPLAAAAFLVGALSLIGIPFTAGFASKWFFAQAGLAYGSLRMILVFAALVISTALNVVYFMGAVIRIFSPAEDGLSRPDKRVGPLRYVALAGLAGLTVLLGCIPGRIMAWIAEGLSRFG
jgi:multicomponent Na+:H+ antiporter subunit D